MDRLPRRRLLLGLSALCIAPRAAHAQMPGKVHRIGYIQTATLEEQEQLTKAFDEGLRELGYLEGRNLVVERRFAWGRQERLPELAAELVRLEVEVIVTDGNPVIGAVKQATSTIPIVMGASTDPVGAGFVASPARPGGNITGLTHDTGLERETGHYEVADVRNVPADALLVAVGRPRTPVGKLLREAAGSRPSRHIGRLFLLPYYVHRNNAFG